MKKPNVPEDDLTIDAGIEVGSALVRHPLIRAVASTGSLRAGRALMDLAAARPDPIPCFTEMSSGNPVFAATAQMEVINSQPEPGQVKSICLH